MVSMGATRTILPNRREPSLGLVLAASAQPGHIIAHGYFALNVVAGNDVEPKRGHQPEAAVDAGVDEVETIDDR